MISEVKKIVEHIQKYLDLDNVNYNADYGYSHVPICVIDSVFSTGRKYKSVINTVNHFCEKIGIENTKVQLPNSEQFSVTDMLALFEGQTFDYMAKEVFANASPTSSRNGILRSEAIYRFCQVLNKYHVNYKADIKKIINDETFEKEIKKIPGQKSGLTLSYFFMLAGSDGDVKPDRMILRFVKSTLGYDVNLTTASELIKKAAKLLQSEYPKLTPRLLDHEIWKYQKKISIK